jgi:hypothetical protein
VVYEEGGGICTAVYCIVGRIESTSDRQVCITFVATSDKYIKIKLRFQATIAIPVDSHKHPDGISYSCNWAR